MRGKLGGGAYIAAINDCDAKLKGDGTISTITEKETHFWKNFFLLFYFFLYKEINKFT